MKIYKKVFYLEDKLACYIVLLVEEIQSRLLSFSSIEPKLVSDISWLVQFDSEGLTYFWPF
jgi:hypothetical protein